MNMNFITIIILLFARAMSFLVLFFLKSANTHALAEWSHGPYLMFPRNIFKSSLPQNYEISLNQHKSELLNNSLLSLP